MTTKHEQSLIDKRKLEERARKVMAEKPGISQSKLRAELKCGAGRVSTVYHKVRAGK